MQTILITGNQGEGKTLLASKLIDKTQIIHYFDGIFTNVFAFKNFINEIKNQEKIIIDDVCPHQKLRFIKGECEHQKKDLIILSQYKEEEFTQDGFFFDAVFSVKLTNR